MSLLAIQSLNFKYMRLSIVFFLGLAYALLTPYVSLSQWSVAQETTLGFDKIVMHLSVEKKFSEMVDVGLYIKGGSLIEQKYPVIKPESSQRWSLLPPIDSYTFPYSTANPEGTFSHGSTKMNMLGFGTYINFNSALNYRKKDWFFIRFNLEGGYVQDNYSFILNNESSLEGNTEGTSINNGKYEFITIGAGTRAGYKRYLDKRNRFSSQVALGLSYYHPHYHKTVSGIGYGPVTPFFGVEYELSIGFAYLFKY